MLLAHSNFKPPMREEEAGTNSSMALRFEMIDGGQGGKICSVIQGHALGEAYTAAHHQSIVASSSNRVDQRIRLRVSYPVRIKPLIENVEWGEESSDRKRDVLVPDVIEFRVLKRLLDRSREVARISVAPDEIALELRTRLKDQIAVHGHKQDWRNDRDHYRIPGVPSGHKGRATGQDRHRFCLFCGWPKLCIVLSGSERSQADANHSHEAQFGKCLVHSVCIFCPGLAFDL